MVNFISFFKELNSQRLKDYFSFAFNNLTNRKIRSWLTLIGIFMGVMSVVALISLGDGLKAAVSAQFGISSTEVISVQAGGVSAAGPPGSGVVNPLTQKDVDDIERLPSVDNSIPRIIEESKHEFNNIVSFCFAVDVPDGVYRKLVYDILDLEAETGRLLKE